ncbi:hypothetical protein R3P38DRAFT_3336080 [Favolaschia claudopus]|uniref:Uncharacterized protein n=1 Tax=Favolaschia claudopus TaxID=2862362 RepID=A0AAV9Z6M1_9AGAR
MGCDDFISAPNALPLSASITENLQQLSKLMEKSLAWSETHACKFDIKKFQLVHFTRNERRYDAAPLQIGQITVSASETATYLGLILDRKLRWRQQVEKAIGKGTAAVLATCRLTRPAFGMPPQFVRSIYVSVVLPKALYGVSVCYEPIRQREGSTRMKGSVGTATRLARLQRTATRLITGALKTTATDAMEFHAFIPPMRLRLNQMAHSAAVRLASLPPSHPLSKHVNWCSTHYLFNAFPEACDTETIHATPIRRTWVPDFSWRIADSTEKGIEEAEALQRDTSTLVVYSDGSGYEEHVGAAAIARDCRGKLHTRRFHLGPASNHTVFEGELVGTILALDIARAARHSGPVAILLDNQAAITALATRPNNPGQYLDVEGNEMADSEAKTAATGGASSNTPLTRRHPAAALRAQEKTSMRGRWSKQWADSRRGVKQRRFDTRPPGRTVLRFYKDRSRQSASIITQLRTGHIGLNAFLHRIHATVSHFLLSCPRFRDARHILRTTLKKPLSLRLLLGSPAHTSSLLQFIQSTKRFPLYHTAV